MPQKKTSSRSVIIDKRLMRRIGVREWGLPTLRIPGQIWRSETHATISCMVESDKAGHVKIETLYLRTGMTGQFSEMPLTWRKALWEYTQAYPASGCCYGPFLAITEQERNDFILTLGKKLMDSGHIGRRMIAHDIGQFASVDFEVYSDRTFTEDEDEWLTADAPKKRNARVKQ